MKQDTVAVTQGGFMNFLDSLVDNRIEPRMVNIVIQQFGGWQAFTDSGMDLFVRGGHIQNKTKRQNLVKGWESQAVASDFYTNNKTSILELAKSRTDSHTSQTVVELISELNALDGQYDLDGVAVGMHVPDSAEYPVVSSAVACFAANEVVYAYNMFKSIYGDDLAV